MQLLILHVQKLSQVKNGFEIFWNDTALNKIQVISSRKVIKFGDGRKSYSKYKAIIPAQIDKTECYI